MSHAPLRPVARLVLVATALAAVASAAALAESFSASYRHAAIEYGTRLRTDRVAQLHARLRAGEVTLANEPERGFSDPCSTPSMCRSSHSRSSSRKRACSPGSSAPTTRGPSTSPMMSPWPGCEARRLSRSPRTIPRKGSCSTPSASEHRLHVGFNGRGHAWNATCRTRRSACRDSPSAARSSTPAVRRRGAAHGYHRRHGQLHRRVRGARTIRPPRPVAPADRSRPAAFSISMQLYGLLGSV